MTSSVEDDEKPDLSPARAVAVFAKCAIPLGLLMWWLMSGGLNWLGNHIFNRSAPWWLWLAAHALAVSLADLAVFVVAICFMIKLYRYRENPLRNRLITGAGRTIAFCVFLFLVTAAAHDTVLGNVILG